MPGRLFLVRGAAAVADWFGAAQAPDDPPRMNIEPGQQVTALTAAGIDRARWGMIPVGRVNARGRPVLETIVNARSETVFAKSAFAGVSRAVVPADGWYEWTGKPRHKTAWRIRAVDGDLLAFAAIHDIWTAPGGRALSQVATVTCAPSADVAPVHDRMGVLLAREDVAIWLHGTPDAAAALMRPWPGGRLVVEPASGVDWTAG